MKKNIHTLFKNKGKVESGKKKERRKSLGRFAGFFMIIAALLSIVVMFSSSYIQTKHLLNERNQLSKETAAQVMEKRCQTSHPMLKQRSTPELRSLDLRRENSRKMRYLIR